MFQLCIILGSVPKCVTMTTWACKPKGKTRVGLYAGSQDQLKDPGNKAGSQDQLKDPENKAGSQDQLKDPENKAGSQDQLKDPKNKAGSQKIRAKRLKNFAFVNTS